MPRTQAADGTQPEEPQPSDRNIYAIKNGRDVVSERRPRRMCSRHLHRQDQRRGRQQLDCEWGTQSALVVRTTRFDTFSPPR